MLYSYVHPLGITMTTITTMVAVTTVIMLIPTLVITGVSLLPICLF